MTPPAPRSRPAPAARVTVLPARVAGAPALGTLLSDVLAAIAPSFAAPCEGRGLCGGCRVLLDPAPPPQPADRRLLGERAVATGWRLACLHRVSGPVTATLPVAARGSVAGGAEPGGPADPTLSRRRDPSGSWSARSGNRILLRSASPPPLVAAAVDVGTTTLSVQMLDLSRAAVLGTATAENPQVVHGDDVLARVLLASRPEGLALLRGELLETIGSLLRDLSRRHGPGEAPVLEMAVAGNPAMTSILAGIAPRSLGRAPYLLPSVPRHLPGGDLPGLPLHPRARVDLIPAAGPFVGGDVVAGLAHRRISPARGPVLYLDLGTNGEMALVGRRGTLCASAAAGPALEGRGVSCGMRAADGAIDRVDVAADIGIRVIGGGAPRGACGSGLLDLLAELLRAGIVKPDGAFLDAGEAAVHPRRRLAARLADEGGERVFRLAEGLALTQRDVRELQMARAAVRAGVDLLLAEAGVAEDRVSGVVVAGTFGFHVRPESLAGSGFLPAAWAAAMAFAGNASLAGAREWVLSRRFRRRATALAERCRVLDLASHPDFQRTFLNRLRF